jgi:hypothetical protein
MALRKPLVLVDGNVQQLQAGDTLDAAASEVDVVTLTNGNAGSIVIGQPVYPSGAGSVDLAQANASGTVNLLGFVRDATIATATPGAIQTDGVLAATTGQWDAVTGGTGGLTPGQVYWLDPSTPGKLTATAPTSVGQYVVRVGQAISTTELEITVEPPILL